MPSSPDSRSRLLPLLDFVLLIFAGLLAYALRSDSLILDDRYLLSILLTAFLTVFVLSVSRSYHYMDLNPSALFRRVIFPVLLGFLLIALLGYFSKSSEHYSRIWAGTWVVISLLSILGSRILLFSLSDRLGLQLPFTRHLVLVGDIEQTARLAETIEQDLGPAYQLAGVFTFNQPQSEQPPAEASITTSGDLDALAEGKHALRIDDILFIPGANWDQEKTLEQLQRLEHIPANLYLGPLPLLTAFPGTQRSELGPLSVLGLAREPLDPAERLFKTLQDWVLAAIMLILTAPLLLLIALAVKLSSPGPVLFRQQRYGFRKDVITVYKFRTMRDDQGPDPEVTQARSNDPRVTPVGRFLRRFSLDELPQLLNVLNGTMALIGPRPLALPHDDHFATRINHYLNRHKVTPGITGWAQAHGLKGEIRTQEDMQRRLEHDLYYVENWSPVLDMEILLRTLYIVLIGRNAY